MKEFLEFLEEKAKNKNTRLSYEKSISDFLNYFFIETIDGLQDVKPLEIRGYRDYLKNSGLESSTVNAKLRPIRAFYSFLWKQEYISTNQMLKVEGLKEGRKNVNVFTDSEYEAMIKSCKNSQQEITLRLVFELGLRVSETRRAKYTDIQDGRLVVVGKGDVRDSLKISDKLKDLIDEEFKKSNTQYILSRNNKNISSVSIWKRFKTIMTLAGIPPERMKTLSTHKGRHWFVSTLLEKGVPLTTASMLARHSDVKVTQRYAHAKKGQLDLAISSTNYI